MLNPYVLIRALTVKVLLVASSVQGIAASNPATPAGPKDCTPIGKFEIQPRDIVMGANNAPITIIEYASMTCPHCAHAHETVLPLVKKNYIDKGLVRFVFRDFPLDNLALAASVLTRCVSKDAYYPFVATLFAKQREWATSSDVKAALKDLSAGAGLNAKGFDACLQNKSAAQPIIKSLNQGMKDYCITGTPTTILNGRVLSFPEAGDFAQLDVVLRAELQKLGKLPAYMTAPAKPAAPAPSPAGRP